MDINIIGPINNLSYGIVTGNIVHNLTLLGHNVSLFPINSDLSAEAYLHDSIRIALKNAEMPNFNAPCVRIWHQFNMSQFVGLGKHIGFPIFELDTFTEQEKHHLYNGCDGLAVCSEWAAQICADNAGIYDSYNVALRTKVVPLGVNTNIFFPANKFHPCHRRKTTVFLNVGKWEVRKGHKDLVRYFNETFTKDDDVELWLMTGSPFLKQSSNDVNEETQETWEKLYKDSPLGNKVKFIPRVETQTEVAEIMRQADFGIFPAKAEGWNLDLLEMMACGKYCIATNYSGHTEFCNEKNSLLVNIKGLVPAFHKPWFTGQGNWAVLDDKEVKDHMRRLYNMKQNGEDITNREGIKTAQEFSWENTARSLEKACL